MFVFTVTLMHYIFSFFSCCCQWSTLCVGLCFSLHLWFNHQHSHDINFELSLFLNFDSVKYLISHGNYSSWTVLIRTTWSTAENSNACPKTVTNFYPTARVDVSLANECERSTSAGNKRTSYFFVKLRENIFLLSGVGQVKSGFIQKQHGVAQFQRKTVALKLLSRRWGGRKLQALLECSDSL